MPNLKIGSHVPNGFLIEHMLKQECPKVCHLSLTGVEMSISPDFFLRCSLYWQGIRDLKNVLVDQPDSR